MKKIGFLMGALVAMSFGFISCNQQKTVSEETQVTETLHNSQNSLDWAGTYAGVIPCANCEGINVRLTLDSYGTYTLTMQYIGKGEDVFSTSGDFAWNDAGSQITLDSDSTQRYKVGEGMLFMLDMDGNIITGDLADMYILTKQ